MPATAVKTETIDRILAIQLVVSWAGEAAEDPKRLAWWQTDLVDPLGGGSFFERLCPRTHKWAALQSAREVAKHTDDQMRQQLPEPDQIRTLFFWGFETNQLLEERLQQLKTEGRNPETTLPLPWTLASDWNPEALKDYLQGLSDAADYTTKREGRELKKPSADDPVGQLAAALLPLEAKYQLPYFRSKES